MIFERVFSMRKSRFTHIHIMSVLMQLEVVLRLRRCRGSYSVITALLYQLLSVNGGMDSLMIEWLKELWA